MRWKRRRIRRLRATDAAVEGDRVRELFRDMRRDQYLVRRDDPTRPEDEAEVAIGRRVEVCFVELSDDIAAVIARVGDDNLVVGTDYGHTDTSAEIEALRLIGESGTVAKASAAKILGALVKIVMQCCRYLLEFGEGQQIRPSLSHRLTGIAK